VEAAPALWPTAVTISAITLFLDVLELSFGRILWFIRTLRFWLYFALHLGLSCFAAYLLRTKIPEWYLLSPIAAFLGVAVISNTDVKIAGYSLLPIATLFITIKAKMFEQAAEDKAAEVARATLIERLNNLPTAKIANGFRAGLLGASYSAEKVQKKERRASELAAGDEAYFKRILIVTLVKVNRVYAEANIVAWEQDKDH